MHLGDPDYKSMDNIDLDSVEAIECQISARHRVIRDVLIGGLYKSIVFDEIEKLRSALILARQPLLDRLAQLDPADVSEGDYS